MTSLPGFGANLAAKFPAFSAKLTELLDATDIVEPEFWLLF